MDLEKLIRLTRGKSKMISLKINPELLALLDSTIKQDKNINSRSEFMERCIIRYLKEKGKI